MTTASTERVAEIEALMRRPYAHILEREADGRYGALLLEFPGVVADGDTPDEAVAALDEALRTHLDVMLEQGRRIPDPLFESDYSGRVSLRIPPSLHAEAAQLAASLGVSMNRFLSDAVARHVGAMSAREQPALPRRYRRRAAAS